MKRYLLIIIFSVFASSVFAQGYKVIVNSANNKTSFTKKEVSDYFLKKKKRWTDKTSIIPVDLSSKSSVRAAFSKTVHKKSTSQVRAYWQQIVFSGRATPPREFANDKAVIAFVKANKGAIGYISSGTSSSGVKVITIN